MPGQIELPQHILGKPADLEARQDAFEIAPVQHVELAERDAPGADLLHGALVLAAPGVGEGEPVDANSRAA